MELTAKQVQFEFKHVLHTALWSETDDNGSPLDSAYDLEDFDQNSVSVLWAKYEQFLEVVNTMIPNHIDLDWEQVAHDFWLTCNGHGAGFWDRPVETYHGFGAQLSAICDGIYLGDVVIGDNGELFIE